MKGVIFIMDQEKIGKYIRYVSSVSDLAYMTDDDIYRQIKLPTNTSFNQPVS